MGRGCPARDPSGVGDSPLSWPQSGPRPPPARPRPPLASRLLSSLLPSQGGCRSLAAPAPSRRAPYSSAPRGGRERGLVSSAGSGGQRRSSPALPPGHPTPSRAHGCSPGRRPASPRRRPTALGLGTGPASASNNVPVQKPERLSPVPSRSLPCPPPTASPARTCAASERWKAVEAPLGLPRAGPPAPLCANLFV